MKTAVTLSIALLTFLSMTRAAPPDPNATLILLETRFIDIPDAAAGTPGAAPLPEPLDVASEVPGLLGVLSDPHYQTVIRELSKRKGVDRMSPPSMTTRSGQKATVEVVRELACKDEAGKKTIKEYGFTVALLPRRTEDDQIDLDLSPQIVDFEGFVKHDSGWEEPILKERKAKAHVLLTSGQTIVLEMDPKTKKQIVEEEDNAGHIISTKTVLHKMRTLVFVTAYLVDPFTGKPRVP